MNKRTVAPLWLAGALVLGACMPACHVVAAAGVGFALSQEFTDNAHSMRMEGTLPQIWAVTQRTLDGLSLDPIKIDEPNHVIDAVVRGAQVTVHVRAHEANETVVSVTAKSYGRYQNDLAQEILFRIKERMR